MRSAALAAGLSLGLLSAWLAGLFAGWLAHGGLHVLLLGAVVLFPWKALRA